MRLPSFHVLFSLLGESDLESHHHVSRSLSSAKDYCSMSLKKNEHSLEWLSIRRIVHPTVAVVIQSTWSPYLRTAVTQIFIGSARV